jgi:hypothetical protein
MVTRLPDPSRLKLSEHPQLIEARNDERRRTGRRAN